MVRKEIQIFNMLLNGLILSHILVVLVTELLRLVDVVSNNLSANSLARDKHLLKLSIAVIR